MHATGFRTTPNKIPFHMAKSTSARQKRTPRRRGTRRSGVMVFTRSNYRLMLLGLAMITVGYVIMRLENEVDGMISLYVAPLIILGGYLEIIHAILKRPSVVE